MTDRVNSDLAALLTPAPAHGVQFSQGVVLSWNNELLSNQIEWRGITLTDVPLVEGINALVIREGDVVGMLGWAPENSKGVGTWWIIGKLSNPGEFVGDLDVTAKIFRFVTEDNNPLAFFGKESDGDPLWILYYGGADGQSAIRIVNANDLVINYRDGQDAVRISGTAGDQTIRVFDNAGNEVFGTDGDSGVGLSRPYLNYHLVPSFSANSLGDGSGSLWPSTTSGSYIGLLEGHNSMWHPKFSYTIVTTTTGGGSTDWRILFDGVTAVSGNNSSSGLVDVPGWGSTTLPGHERDVEIEARTAGGATRSYVQVTRMYGRQS